MGGVNLLNTIGWTITASPPSGVDLQIVVTNVTEDLKVTVPGVKVPTYKLTVKTTGLKYTAVKTTLTEGADQAVIQLWPTTGYALPLASESMDDYVTATMGGSPVAYEAEYDPAYVIAYAADPINAVPQYVTITIPKDPATVTGAVSVTAQGHKLPTYTTKFTDINATVISPPITAPGQNFVVELRPKTGYKLPTGTGDIHVYEFTGGVQSVDLFDIGMRQYDYVTNMITLTVPIHTTTTIEAAGAKIPAYNFTFKNTSSPTGLTYHATPASPIEHRDFTVTFEPRAGYILPASASVAVEMGGGVLTPGSYQYSRMRNSDGRPIGVLIINDVTDNLNIDIAGKKIVSYTLDMSNLTTTVTPILEEIEPLVITLKRTNGYDLPANKSDITITSHEDPAMPINFDYNSATGVLSIPDFAKTGVFDPTDFLVIKAAGVKI
jgi:hypothetical protein